MIGERIEDEASKLHTSLLQLDYSMPHIVHIHSCIVGEASHITRNMLRPLLYVYTSSFRDGDLSMLSLSLLTCLTFCQ